MQDKKFLKEFKTLLIKRVLRAARLKSYALCNWDFSFVDKIRNTF